MDIQARIPPALCCIHNIIHFYGPDDLRDCEPERAAAESSMRGSADESGIYGEVANGFITANERDVMAARRDEIPEALWQSHVNYIRNTQHVS